ncbi:Os04g0476650 [Oryza sativa Japonica Group]|uniref:Os04g0476650 protein n=1 Tax=Oryza sativa subsp. japonica TaxID=39947 RepID=A0A0P0WBL5_ORYSJ|nr:hypothetical protein EE612_023956 [Oryza sativa]BAS89696.1 Os04g0476650 [Oryza sativa Japonica Group]
MHTSGMYTWKSIQTERHHHDSPHERCGTAVARSTAPGSRMHPRSADDDLVYPTRSHAHVQYGIARSTNSWPPPTTSCRLDTRKNHRNSAGWSRARTHSSVRARHLYTFLGSCVLLEDIVYTVVGIHLRIPICFVLFWRYYYATAKAKADTVQSCTLLLCRDLLRCGLAGRKRKNSRLLQLLASPTRPGRSPWRPPRAPPSPCAPASRRCSSRSSSGTCSSSPTRSPPVSRTGSRCSPPPPTTRPPRSICCASNATAL